MNTTICRSVGVVALTALCAAAAFAADYKRPPPNVVALVDAPPPPAVRMSPDHAWMLLIERDALPSIADVSRPMLRLAGIRIDPSTNGRFTTGFDRGLSLRRLGVMTDRQLPVPPGGRIASVRWSHDSRHLAYTVVTADGTELWGGSVDPKLPPRRLTGGINTILSGLTWMPDGENLVVLLVPNGRGPEPAAPRVPSGPVIQETHGETSPLRTYQDLLSSPHDERLFAHYAITQMALVSVRDGRVSPLGPPALYRSKQPSPDGHSLLVARVERPFSYQMPWSSFPQVYEVWDMAGRVLHTVARVPAAENVPIGGVRIGPRNIFWKPNEAATIVWAEALDGGDPKREVPHRDRWMTHAAPFADPAQEMVRTEQRAQGLYFFDEPGVYITQEYDRDRRWTRSLLHDADGQPRVLDDRSIRDRYGDPGRLTTVPTASGHRVVLRDGPWVFRTGQGASPEGIHPFLDRQHLLTLASERLWQCTEGTYESVSAVWLSNGKPRFVTRHETPTSPPNYRLHTPGGGRGVTALTHFPDPTPQIRGIHKQVVTYERDDGVTLSATLYLPADYREGRRLPLLVWAYPREFNDPVTAGQVTRSPYRFTRISGSSHLHLLTQGYAIMDGATMPVIGHPESMNDTFVEQIVAAAAAAIDKAAAMGVADPERVGVGGHSYGAFMTANLLAHCDLFRAGVARSGAYNRTLTPFGFQAERRPLWEAPDIYFKVSPFMHAAKIDDPLLLIHGMLDNNSGTFPMQSRRLYAAIKGNGGKARLVMLPAESHGYRARESVLHVLAETIEFFDRYLKDERPGSPELEHPAEGGS